jgi:hypothetical protein
MKYILMTLLLIPLQSFGQNRSEDLSLSQLDLYGHRVKMVDEHLSSFEKGSQLSGDKALNELKILKDEINKVILSVKIKQNEYEKNRIRLIKKIETNIQELKNLTERIKIEMMAIESNDIENEIYKREMFLLDIKSVQLEQRNLLLRIRKRPDLLTSEWDSLIDESMSQIKENPLYQENTNSGENPLFEDNQ